MNDLIDIGEAESQERRRDLPRVLYVVAMDPYQKFGSLEEQMLTLAKAFELDHGLFCPLFISVQETNASDVFCQAGLRAKTLDLSVFHWSRLRKLSRLISQLEIDLIHWNFTDIVRNSYLWWISILHPKIGHCFTDHISRGSTAQRSPGRIKAAAKGLLSRRYDKIFCVSQFVFDDLRRSGVRSELVLRRHFVNISRFQPDRRIRSRIREEFGAEDCFVLLTVAQLISEKGVEILLKSLAVLPEKVIVWIVGDGPQREKLGRLSRDLKVQTRTVFHGLQADVAPFMQAADCFVCPSLWKEAAGLANIEAAACGIPVIASRIGGIPEYVEDRRTGLLFSPGDHRELARCVTSLLEDSDLYQRLSLQARESAIAKFSASEQVAQYLATYRDWESSRCSAIPSRLQVSESEAHL